ADENKCRAHVDDSTAIATALLPAIGYERASEVAKAAKEQGLTIRAYVLANKILDEDEFDALISPEAVCRLGMPR
ncbi:MAG: aspartate ammonia-lyase, partial [Planctomycetes bacterium]|nr:aspartate ammonia-lyase [Planctomycetota bacterium]